MVRCKVPGGKLTADQYLVLDRLAGLYGNGTLRLTTRQGIQLHGVLKQNLASTIAAINDSLLTTLGACGDVQRNVMCCPAPIHDDLRDQLQQAADLLAAHMAPRTSAYHEIWLNGERLELDPESKGSRDRARADVEPIYGRAYLPRKFKTGLILRDDNCIDIFSQDLGFVADVEAGRIVGYNVLAGGGMGQTNGNPNTFPQLARPICWIPAASLVNVAEAVVKLFRDHGNRANRRRARLKYLVHDWGVEQFRQVLEGYVGGRLALPKEIPIRAMEDHLGWHEQGDGRYFYGVSVENGRIRDQGRTRLRTALRKLMQRLRPALRITANQDLLLCDLAAEAKAEIDRTLIEHGVRSPFQLSLVRRLSMACPAMPTCGLALSESERVLPDLLNQLEGELQRLQLDREQIVVRMTGCPNGCARPYQADIGIVGRSGDKYTVYVGGRLLGDRLNFVLRDLVPLSEIVPLLVPILEAYRNERLAGEGFGEFCYRLGPKRLQGLLPQKVA